MVAVSTGSGLLRLRRNDDDTLSASVAVVSQLSLVSGLGVASISNSVFNRLFKRMSRVSQVLLPKEWEDLQVFFLIS